MRRDWASMGRAMAKSELSGRVSAPVMWLLARRMTADGPTDMIRTIEAEDPLCATGHLQRIMTPALIVEGEKDHLYRPELFRSTPRGFQAVGSCTFRARHTWGQSPTGLPLARHWPS